MNLSPKHTLICFCIFFSGWLLTGCTTQPIDRTAFRACSTDRCDDYLRLNRYPPEISAISPPPASGTILPGCLNRPCGFYWEESPLLNERPSDFSGNPNYWWPPIDLRVYKGGYYIELTGLRAVCIRFDGHLLYGRSATYSLIETEEGWIEENYQSLIQNGVFQAPEEFAVELTITTLDGSVLFASQRPRIVPGVQQPIPNWFANDPSSTFTPRRHIPVNACFFPGEFYLSSPVDINYFPLWGEVTIFGVEGQKIYYEWPFSLDIVTLLN